MSTEVQLSVIQPRMHVGFNLMRRRVVFTGTCRPKLILNGNIPDNFEKIV